jgi:hypothetical protein
MQRGEGVVVQAYSLSEFKQAVDDSTSIDAGDKNGWRVVMVAGNESSCLRLSNAGQIAERLRQRTGDRGNNDDKRAARGG